MNVIRLLKRFLDCYHIIYEHNLTLRIYVLHKITIALEFILYKLKVAANLSNRVKYMFCINWKFREETLLRNVTWKVFCTKKRAGGELLARKCQGWMNFKFFHLLWKFYLYFLSQFVKEKLILLVFDNLSKIRWDKKMLRQLAEYRGMKKKVVLQLFLSNFFYFPYCSVNSVTLSTLLQTEYYFFLFPKVMTVQWRNALAS